MLGFTISRKIEKQPTQKMQFYNNFIKDDIYVAPRTPFMPITCRYKVSIQKNKIEDKVEVEEKISSLNFFKNLLK